MDNSTKTIECSLKIFALIKLLLQDCATFNETIKTISDDKFSNFSENNAQSVTLNKYLNTLKLFGLNVYKEKGKYHLINPPYKIDLSKEELKAFYNLKECAKQFKNDECKELLDFLKSIELRFSESTQAFERMINTNTDYRFYYEKYSAKVDICTKFCNDDYIIDVIYLHRGKEQKLTGTATEIIFRTQAAKLQIIEQTTKDIKLIPIDKIVDIKQLPTKSQTTYSAGRVTVYGLRGRLAKNYKLREWETSNGFRDGWLMITNKEESEEELTERILKYGNLCKVFTPHSYRDKIKSEIERTLALYEN